MPSTTYPHHRGHIQINNSNMNIHDLLKSQQHISPSNKVIKDLISIGRISKLICIEHLSLNKHSSLCAIDRETGTAQKHSNQPIQGFVQKCCKKHNILQCARHKIKHKIANVTYKIFTNYTQHYDPFISQGSFS